MSLYLRVFPFLSMLVLVACYGTGVNSSGLNTPTPTSATRIGHTAVIPSAVSNRVMKPQSFYEAPNRDLFALTQELIPINGPLSRTVYGERFQYFPGRIDTFWLVDLAAHTVYQSDFKLVTVTPHAYWYLEEGLDIDLSRIERSAFRNPTCPN